MSFKYNQYLYNNGSVFMPITVYTCEWNNNIESSHSWLQGLACINLIENKYSFWEELLAYYLSKTTRLDQWLTDRPYIIIDYLTTGLNVATGLTGSSVEKINTEGIYT